MRGRKRRKGSRRVCQRPPLCFLLRREDPPREPPVAEDAAAQQRAVYIWPPQTTRYMIGATRRAQRIFYQDGIYFKKSNKKVNRQH